MGEQKYLKIKHPSNSSWTVVKMIGKADHNMIKLLTLDTGKEVTLDLRYFQIDTIFPISKKSILTLGFEEVKGVYKLNNIILFSWIVYVNSGDKVNAQNGGFAIMTGKEFKALAKETGQKKDFTELLKKSSVFEKGDLLARLTKLNIVPHEDIKDSFYKAN